MSTDASAEILARLHRARETGSLGDLGIDYWDRGGPPGKGYEADLLTERADGEVLLRTRFDLDYRPPFRTEQYAGQRPTAATVRALSALVIQAFEGSFSEEAPAPIGDVTKITIKAYVVPPAPPADQGAVPPPLEKTFFQKLPGDLAALGDLAKARIEALLLLPPHIVSKRK
jgi:hypothetical protein